MSQLKRYSLWSDEWGIEQSDMVETDNGGWITYDDYAALAAENKRLREHRDTLIERLDKAIEDIDKLAAKEGRDAK